MSKNINSVAVLGLGRVGTLAATLLHEAGFDVTGFDKRSPQEKPVFRVKRKSAATEKSARSLLTGFDAVLSC